MPEIGQIVLVATPPNVAMNGQAVVTATVTDVAQAFVPDGVPIEFNTNSGSVAPKVRPTTNGQASVIFTAGAQAGSASVIALSGSVFGRVTIIVV